MRDAAVSITLALSSLFWEAMRNQMQFGHIFDLKESLIGAVERLYAVYEGQKSCLCARRLFEA